MRQRRLAVQRHGERLMVFVGQVVEVTEVYLVRAEPGAPWRHAAVPPDGTAFPEMKVAAVQAGLAALSPSIVEVMLFDNRRGLELVVHTPASRSSLLRDIDTAVDMLIGLESLPA